MRNMINIATIYGPAAWAALAIKELPMMIRNNNTNRFVILTPIAAVLLTIDGKVFG